MSLKFQRKLDQNAMSLKFQRKLEHLPHSISYFLTSAFLACPISTLPPYTLPTVLLFVPCAS
jgi:hypothetical protein